VSGPNSGFFTADKYSSADDDVREKAMATVQQGQKAENLLDFDADEPLSQADSGFMGSSGMASMISTAPAGPSVPTTNPLDELMDLFSSSGMTAPTSAPVPAFPIASAAPLATVPSNESKPPQQQPAGNAQDDLMGLF
jgi:AP-1 complex subunit beta-1